MRPHVLAVPLCCLLSSLAAGCLKQILTDGQIAATRRASVVLDTIGDFELAQSAAQSGLVQFEGMHRLAPSNTDALFMLAKGWTGYAYAFVEDEIETAQDAGNDDRIDYERNRARMAYDRGVFYGLELMTAQADGFDRAKKNQGSLSKWLADHFASKDDVPTLFWTGYAWMERVNVMQGDDAEGPALVAELYIGVAMVERAVALDPSFEHYAGLVVLGGYHARTGMAELDQSKQLFDVAMAKTKGKTLLVPFTYASTYACMKRDGALYRDMMNRVLQPGDRDADQRLPNAVAKRRARRWISKKRMKERCGMDPFV
jgi:TRAP transporter T-component